MIKDFFSIHFSDRKTAIILFLFLFQMVGIRFFSGIGFILSALIFILLVSNVKITSSRYIPLVILPIFAALFQYLKGSEMTYCVLLVLYVINAVLLVYYVVGKDIRSDFKAALKIFVIQALLSAIVYIVIPKNFLFEIHWNKAMLQNRTFLYVFYYELSEFSMLSFLPLPRISGWAWEPGCLQLLVNLYICLEIFDRVKIKKLILPSVVVILTASTSGYIIWAVNMLLYFTLSNAKRIFTAIPIGIMAGIVLIPLIAGNISEKLMIGSSNANGSGVIRMRDFYTGIAEVKAYPLTGIDVSDLANSKQYQKLEDEGMSHIENLSRTWYDAFNYAAGGYCNGFFAMHMYWGVIGIFLLYWFLKCKLWKRWSYGKKWYFFPIIISLALISEPFSNSSFFLFLCLYNVLEKNRSHVYIHSNSNI